MNVFIVESPGKVKHIQGYLDALFGQGAFAVVATVGHFCGLPKMDGQAFSDVVNTTTWQEHWAVHKPDVVARLKARIDQADRVILATDADREGEAIAWHLTRMFRLDPRRVLRVRCTEITKAGLKAALANPVPLDERLVAAQRARQVLDYEFGMELSRPLWRFGCRSAGRVQSAAVRMIVDREHAIRSFRVQGFTTIEAAYDGGLKAQLHVSAPAPIAGELVRNVSENAGDSESNDHGNDDDGTVGGGDIADDGEKALDAGGYRLLRLADPAVTASLARHLKEHKHTVSTVSERPSTRRPPPPFTTSQLLSTASTALKMAAKKTTALAQELFEKGLVTYIRTDSTTLSEEAIQDIRAALKEKAPNLLPAVPQTYSNKAHAQGAHEAIRPTKMSQPPEALASLSKDERALYDLIWQRTLVCQAADAQLVSTVVTISVEGLSGYALIARGMVIKSVGFMGLLPKTVSNKDSPIPATERGQRLRLVDLKERAGQTKPPSRFTEARLTTHLERLGIGRPATYSAVMTSIVEREYVVCDPKVRELSPTKLGELSDKLLRGSFDLLTRSDFTASIEKNFDRIAEGRLARETFLTTFDTGLRKMLALASHKLASFAQANPDLDRDAVVRDTKPCGKCGAPRNLVVGRLGRMARCSAEACGHVEVVEAKEHAKSPCHKDSAHGPMARLSTRRDGRVVPFFKCLTCSYTTSSETPPPPCPLCRAPTVQRQGPQGTFWGCCRFRSDGCKGVAPEPQKAQPRKRQNRREKTG